MEEVPFEDRMVPRAEIEWDRSAWWWIPLTRSVQPAIKMTTLVVGLIAVALAQGGVRLAARVFEPQWLGFETLLRDQPRQLFWSPIITWCTGLIQGVTSIELNWNGLGFFTFTAIWLTAIFSLVGGVLARRAMVELGQQTIAPWGESIKIVFGRWISLLWATGMHLVGLFFFLIPVFLLGLIASWGNVGGHIAGILLLIWFPFVFAVGRLCMSMIFCYPFSVCAIVAEKKADAFEGFSRSNAYLYQRPVAALACVVLMLGIGLAGEQLVYWTLTFGWGLMRNVFMLGTGAAETAATLYLQIGDDLKAALVGAYWFSFAWSASGGIYLILRRSVDATELYELDSLENPQEKDLPEIPSSPPSETSDDTDSSKNPSSEAATEA